MAMWSTRKPWLTHVLSASAVCAMALLAPISNAQEPAPTDQTLSISIPEGPLIESIQTLSEIYGISVLATDDLIRGLESSAISGSFEAKDALEAMLAGTGLDAASANDGNYVLVASSAEADPDVQPAPVDASSNERTSSDFAEVRQDPVIVYGERVERRLEETLSTISVISEEEIEQLAQQNLFEAAIGIPNTLYTEGDGYPAIRGQQITGAGSNLGTAIITGTEPRTVIILDGFAHPSSWANNAYNSLLDLEQVEIFRGPQSTLRGRNSNAGMIVVKTLDPTFAFQARAMDEYSYDEAAEGAYRLGGVVSGPLIADHIAGRLTIETREGRDSVGDFQTILNSQGQPLEFRSDGDAENAANIESTFVRGKLLIRPTGSESFQANLIGSYNEGTTPLFRNQIAGSSGGVDVDDRVPAFPTDYRVVDSETYFLGADVDYATDKFGAFELLVGHTNDTFFSNEERSSSGVTFNDSENTTTTVEGLWRFGDNSSSWNGIVGLSYANRTTELDALAFVTVPLDLSTDTDAYSVYTDLRYNVSERLELNFGGRYLSTEQFRNVVFVLPIITDETIKDDVFLPQFGARFELNETQNLSLSVRRGFGDGAVSFNNATFQPYSYDPEFSWTAEASWKGTFNDERGRFSAVAFYNDFEDQQVNVLVATTPFNVFEIRNVSESRSYGLEIEGQYDLTDSVAVSAALGLIDTEIVEGTGLDDIDGNDFGFDPDYTLQFNANWRPTDRVTLDGSVVTLPEYFSSASNNEVTKGGGYTIVNAGGAYDFGRFKARVFVQNLFDELAFSSRFELVGGGTVLAPRTVGFTLTADF